MFTVIRCSHERHGSVIQIESTENGNLLTPFQAVQSACKEQKLWQDSGIEKVRILIEGQVMTCKQAEQWAHEEYKTLPKCSSCYQILSGEVHTHQLCDGPLFCSKACADQDYLKEIERLKDEEEIEYL
jgi:hypothetical protein